MNVGHPVGAVVCVLIAAFFLILLVIACWPASSGSPVGCRDTRSAPCGETASERKRCDTSPQPENLSYLHAVPVYDPRAVGGYRHSSLCDPEAECVCGMDEALLLAERLAWEQEQGA